MKTLQRLHRSSATHWVGNGFPVRNLFDYKGLGQQLTPFLLLDYVAPHPFPPGRERRGVEAHPHKGFETVTIVYDGELEHRDSGGGGGRIGAGDVQWMTAGRGIVHQEFHTQEFTRNGGVLHMVQLWVNLRAADKSAPPRYQTLFKADIPVVHLPEDAGLARVIAGDFSGTEGAARTFSPVNLWDVTLLAGKSAALPLPDGHTSIALVLGGSVVIDGDKQAREGDLAIFQREGTGIALKAEAGAHLLVMDGLPLNEPVVGYGPFVMNTREEINQAFEEYQAGRMGGL